MAAIRDHVADHLSCCLKSENGRIV